MTFEVARTEPEISKAGILANKIRNMDTMKAMKPSDAVASGDTPKLALALNSFEPKKLLGLEMVDEELDSVLDFEDRLAAELATIDQDIAESDDFRLS